MRKILLTAAFAALALTACGGRSGANPGSAGKEVSEAGTVNLNKAGFLQKVVNYEMNPDQWVFLGDKPAIIDFYANWCGPCRTIAPILESLAKEYDGQVDIYKIDVDKEQELAAIFGIQSLPSILFIPMDGSPELRRGAMPKREFVKAINDILLD
ncbi:MAG: thioredoxin [Alistipes sp.]|nr:thioredoxin [Alistipes sp.]